MDQPSSRTILLSRNVSRLLRRGQGYLSRRGFRVVTGRTGREILELAARERPAASVIEYGLRDLRGDVVCRALGTATRAPVPVLIIGPARPPEIARRCQTAGCTGYLASPVTSAAILERLASLLGVQLRRHPRRRLTAPVSFGRTIQEFLGYTRDLSEGGALIESAIRFPPGRRLLLRFYPGDREQLIQPAVTVRVDAAPGEDLYLLGMQFVRPAAARARLEKMLGRQV